MPAITFLIGNGFDLNLGLNTQYKDFISDYLNNNSGDDDIKEFKSYFKEDHELWSDVELALGKLTSKYGSDEEGARKFFKCHTDISNCLGKYLDKEEARLSADKLDIVKDGLINLLNNYKTGFRTDRHDLIMNSLNQNAGPVRFNFLIYNYTGIIDNCFKDKKAIENKLNSETLNQQEFKATISNIIHVHGTTKMDMIFGVNDDSQIGNLELFKNSNPIYKQQFIKQTCNQNNGYGIDRIANGIISSSLILYFYGVSIGDTDALWWARVCGLLQSNPYAQVIIYKYPVPSREANNTTYYIAEDEARDRIISFGNVPADRIRDIKKRIHIDENNKLLGVSGIADVNDMKTRETLMVLANEKVKIQNK